MLETLCCGNRKDVKQTQHSYRHLTFSVLYTLYNYPQEFAQDAVCQNHTGHRTGLWFLPTRPLRLNTNEWINEWIHCIRHQSSTSITIHDTRCSIPFYSTRITTTSHIVTPLCCYLIFNCQPTKCEILIYVHMCISLSRESSDAIASVYGLDGPGIESRCGRDFPHQSRLDRRPTQPPTQ